jgi:exonuclease V gamma subunit
MTAPVRRRRKTLPMAALSTLFVQIARDRERDVSEKIALGMAQPSMSQELQLDQRLFNQSEVRTP